MRKRKKKDRWIDKWNSGKRINVICEGDSWLDLPIRTNIPKELKRINQDYLFLRLDKSGDEILQIMSGPQKNILRKKLNKYKDSADLILFSGGGNDLVGTAFYDIIEQDEKVNYDLLYNRLQLIEFCFIELIIMRNIICPHVPIITHTYDYPHSQNLPIKIGPLKIGPWMYPAFKEKKWENESSQNELLKYMIDKFSESLINLSKEFNNFYVVDLRGTLEKSDWGDEIHPTRNGFNKVAIKINESIQKCL